MQLKSSSNKKNIKRALATATSSILGIAPAASADTVWSGSISNLYYSETDRVTAIEPAIVINAEFEGEKKWTSKLVVDSLTGASHNGAVPSRNAQTFTSPSGSGSYDIAAGQPTLDTSFLDTRFALSTGWSQPFAQDYEFSTGLNVSSEYDFKSASVNGSVSKYLDRKNTKLSLGVNLEVDSINPVGGAPQGQSTMASKVITGTNESKQVIDLLLGWTQVMNRQWIMQFNYNLGMSNGYMNDPYKFTSEVVAPGPGNAGDPTGQYYYDKRPEKRLKHALFVDSKYHMGSWGILGNSYRYFFDDWGVQSHTLEVNYRIPLSAKWYIEPGARYYMQSKADFYRYFTVQGVALPEFMSSDYRLGDMTAMTFGLEVGTKLASYGKELSFRAQMYTQSGDSHPGEAYGQLVNQDLYPKVTAVIGQIIYKF